eukprot:TRINITY_DN123922_c0_g1_i1.p1 TRINITY_DN123922_c0_g1~~TRINITY_DN123922_c0_g1_i1.p1  ORF type:complete len:333 (+),score=68.19 TRINITY_DN123922_c0_g1_i1:125-1123(+)
MALTEDPVVATGTNQETLRWPEHCEALLDKAIVRPAPEGSKPPESGEKAIIHYVLRLGDSSGKVVDSSRDRGEPFSFTLGRYEAFPALDRAVATMRQGELATFTVNDFNLAYGSAACGCEAVPASAVFHCEVELLEVSQALTGDEDIQDLSLEERLEAALRGKDAGNLHFKAGDLERALSAYRKALNALGFDTDGKSLGEEDAASQDRLWSGDALRLEARSKTALAASLNAAQCCLKLERATEAFQHSSCALSIDQENAKAFYRRGLASMSLQLLDRARADLMEAARREPKNAEIRGQLQVCQQQTQAAQQKARDAYGGMFDRASKAKQTTS